jgi:asparagine synthase (glutamine-hydrolysing)
VERIAGWSLFFDLPEIDALLRGRVEGDVLASYREALGRCEGRSLLSRLLYLNARTYLLDDLLPKMDRMSMAHGLETRSPFLDRSLAEYVATLPDSFKRAGRHGKVVLKKAVEGLLPSATLRRKKHGFGVPLGAWFRGELRPLVQDTLMGGSRVGRRLEPTVIRRIFDDHVTGRADRGHQLWTLLTLELWMRKHSFS